MKTARASVLVIGTLAAILVSLSVAARLPGQGGGSRAGVPPGQTYPGQSAASGSVCTALDHEAVQQYITIVGRAEIRVKPTAIRVIMALSSQAATAEECMKANAEKEAALTEALVKLGVAEDKVFMDFISMLPVYEWTEEKREDKAYLVEKLSGYLGQTNVHIEVDNESQARAAVRAAFQLGITDIISFDYWCDSLDDYNTALGLAVARKNEFPNVAESVHTKATWYSMQALQSEDKAAASAAKLAEAELAF